MNVHFKALHICNKIVDNVFRRKVRLNSNIRRMIGVSSGVGLPALAYVVTFIINTLMSGHSRSNNPRQIKLHTKVYFALQIREKI